MIDFNKVLKEANLPSCGSIVSTPNGDKVLVAAYVFKEIDYAVVKPLDRDFEFYWPLDLLGKCTWEEEYE